jgi:uncharacterized LabA/DUF88 family protein
MPDKQVIKKCLYVDLSNLYGGIAELFSSGIYLDFASLMPVLDELFGGIDAYKVYGAYMGLEPSMPVYKQEFIKAQNEFINSARAEGVYFGQGKISKHGQEKGVDMMLGVDMVNDAHLGSYTDYILLTGDADFSYPINLIKNMGMNFHYCGFANRFALSFAYAAWRKVVIDYNKHFITNIAPPMRLPKKLIIRDVYDDKSVKKKSVNSV